MLHSGLCCTCGGGRLSAVEWLEHALGIRGKVLDGGNSVANMIIEAAYALGCRPIIMVGYDLAYTEAPAIQALSPSPWRPGRARLSRGRPRGSSLTGRRTTAALSLTEAKWMIEANWIERFAKDHPRLHLINTAENGLAIKNSDEDARLPRQRKNFAPSTGICLDAPPGYPGGRIGGYPPERLSKAIERMSHSFQKVQEIVRQMQEELAQADQEQARLARLLELGAQLENQLAFKHCLATCS